VEIVGEWHVGPELVTERRLQICRICGNSCAVVVEVEGGRAVRVTGDRDNPLYRGYVCTKGRSLPAFHNGPDRLLRPLARNERGELAEIPLGQAIDEIAARLGEVLAVHGPRSVVAYAASGSLAQNVLFTFLSAFMKAIGSPWPPFTAASIDQGGKPTAAARHGTWQAPSQGFDDPDVMLLVGMNPLVSHMGFPRGSPIEWLRERKAAGMRLFVVDPRRSETARHADRHLQPRPGEDVALLAGMLCVILAEGLEDRAFLDAHAIGLEGLRAVVERFTPERVATQAGVDADELIAVARDFAVARSGFAAAGTGANMTGHATLVEYLILCLQTVCGRWKREGDRVRNAPALARAREYRAQATPPSVGTGPVEPLRVPGRTAADAETQITDLVDEMLLPGDGQIKAMLCIGGNPAAAWPDQARTVEALQALDLLVVVDPVLSTTAKLAHYVVPPKAMLEVPAVTLGGSASPSIGLAPAGLVDSYAQYAGPAVDPPPGAEVIEEWELLFEIASRLGRTVRIGRTELEPDQRPTTDDILGMLTRSARVSLDEVKRHPHGAYFVDETIRVLPAEPGWTGRLDVGNAEMMAELGELAAARSGHDIEMSAFPFRLTSRRMPHVQNSMMRGYPSAKDRPYNPAFMHPDDLADLGLVDGDLVEIASRAGSIRGRVAAEPGIRRGVVSMSHGFGDVPGAEDAGGGANTGLLVDVGGGHDRWSGQPRMSNVPVRVLPIDAGTGEHA
jgi:anaerobic selenocysteine-containing dehydrogenase